MKYQITVQPSGHVFEANENEYILDAALRQGISFPYGCRSGSCGTCLGQVVSGTVEYPEGLPLTVMEHEHEKGRAVFCVSVATSDLVLDVAEISSATEIEIKMLPARVSSLRKLSDDVMEMTLKLPNSERMAFRAGQYIEFLLKDNKRRAFSLANSPSNDEYLELHLRHVEGGYFTEHVFKQMKEKALVRIEGPHGSFFIRDGASNDEGDNPVRPLILIAGGTGFAPIKGMLEQLLEEGDTRPVHFYWGVRREADLYRNDLAKKWALQQEHISYIPVLSEVDKTDGDDSGKQQYRTGYVHTAVLEDFEDLSGFDVYMAGPPPMIDAAKEGFVKQGLPEGQLFYDSFEYAKRT